METAGLQLFERVELRGETELGKIRNLLDEAVESRLQGAPDGELSEEDRLELHAASANFIDQLRQLVVFAEGNDGAIAASGRTPTTRTQVTPAGRAAASLSVAARSPLLPPLSPPPADAEVAALEAEVTAAALRVSELRTTMQVRLQEQLAAKLAACRPSAELEPAAPEAEAGAQEQEQQDEVGAANVQSMPSAEQQEPGEGPGQQPQAMETGAAAGVQEAGASGGAVQQAAEEDAAQQGSAAEAAAPAPEPLPLSPAPTELQQRLAAAATRMPTLRARLEAANDRLQRVVSAVAADMNRPPPNTVEKAVLGKTPGRPSGAGVGGGGEGENQEPRVSPLVQKAMESGQINTRRRVTRDIQPVPFSQPE